MPKRACPFPEVYSTQLKIHVRQQELSNYGVFGSKYRQEVYEKTKNLLFNGAKAVMGKIWSEEEKSGDLDAVDHTDTSACSQALLKGQTLIGNDGKLTRARGCKGNATGAASCRVCQKNQEPRSRCSQCDRLSCLSCIRQCSSCSSDCCSVCTTIDYSGRYDEVLCCSCST